MPKIEEATKEATIVRKLGRVMKKLGTLPKRGENTFHHYKYVLEADVSDAVREAFAEEGIIIFPHLESYEVKETPKGLITFTIYRFDVTDGDMTLPLRVLSAGHDNPGDKGPFKALTGALKYALLKLLLIPTGDDPERDDANPVPQAEVNIERAASILGATSVEKRKITLGERKEAAYAFIRARLDRLQGKVEPLPEDARLREYLGDILGRPVSNLTLKDQAELDAVEAHVKLIQQQEREGK